MAVLQVNQKLSELESAMLSLFQLQQRLNTLQCFQGSRFHTDTLYVNVVLILFFAEHLQQGLLLCTEVQECFTHLQAVFYRT